MKPAFRLHCFLFSPLPFAFIVFFFPPCLSALDFYYSNNGGKTYSNSTLPYVGTSQSVANIGPVEQEIGFGMVGAFVVNLAVQDEGIAVSFNAGANYSVSNISMFDCFARYGAFPSDQTFFVNAAQWPGIGSDDEQTTTTGAGSLKGDYIVNREHYTNPQDIPLGSTLLKAFGARAHVLLTPDKKSVFATVKKDHVFNANARGNGPNITTYYDQVAKTTDGGKTWNLVYNVFNVNAGNMIHCTSETHCCFPAEAPGVRGTQIICTFDGSNFQVTYNNPDTFSSIVGMAALSEDIWWASGAELDDLAPKNSQFYLSTDGGRSWNPTGPQFSQLYAIDIDCVPSAGQCWALLLNQPNQSFSIATLSP